MSASFSAAAGASEPSLQRALERLDALIDWERRARADASGRLMRQSLAPARDLLDRLGAPDAALTIILVAGTKGKGTVASLVAHGLMASGAGVGLYASPHVERINERVRLGGREISDHALAEALGVAMGARDAALEAASPAAGSTWFDVLTVAALWAMARAGLEFACLECGLGGRLDSTNAVQPLLSILTSVELEHTAILGETRAEIAREKAAICRAGRPLVSGLGSCPGEAQTAVSMLARAKKARLVSVDLDPAASIEARNVALARSALRELASLRPGLPSIPLTPEIIRAARLPGRQELFTHRQPPVVLDGAHVASSLELLLTDLTRLSALEGPPLVIFGASQDKDTGAMLKVLRGRVDRVLCTSPGPGPYASPSDLADQAKRLGLSATAFDDPERALDEALDSRGKCPWVLITGSLHLVGRLRGLLG